MSGVYMRNRNLSSFEYFNTAVAIRNDVTRLVTSRDVPKSYRFIFAVPMAETARSVVFNLVKADAFYPNTARNVDERKRYMTLALADLNQLYQDMQSLLTMGLPIKAARCSPLPLFRDTAAAQAEEASGAGRSRRYDRRASQPVLPIVARRHEAA